MPTLPPERTSSDQRESHQARELAESFGSDPERYDRARPSYPAAMVEAIVAASPGPEIVDVGIGTGIAARQFRAAGCRVLGVEVDARMGEWARKHGFEVEVSAFEAWDPAGRIFDAVIAGQTWHWVDPVEGAAKAAEVLRPDGRLAVFWNAGQPPTDLAQAFAAVYQRVVPDSLAARWAAGARTAYSTPYAKVTEGIRAAGGFGEPEQWTFDWELTYTRDEWLDQLPTTGGHAQFSSATEEEVLAGIGAAIDAAGGSFTVRFTTTVVTAVRT
ncbi:class I SAM-dependent methyltransferase [Nocardia vinacea]|uniref:class I SAM-dependent methyltransferase n=1 Tax=Nocardia vinacea TaxID=96468 RepID=UPI0033DDD94E